MVHTGLFVTFEGGEGAGKSTHIQLLATRLRAEGYTVRPLREPGGTPIGEEIRAQLKQSMHPLCSATELLLFNASRAQLVQDVIHPALAEGEIVLCDRFYDSTIAYQVYGRGLSLASVRSILDFAVGETKPDLTFLIDVLPAVGLKNRDAQTLPGLLDRFDGENLEFHTKVYQGFQACAIAEPERIVTIPYLAGDMPKMQSCMYEALRARLSCE